MTIEIHAGDGWLKRFLFDYALMRSFENGVLGSVGKGLLLSFGFKVLVYPPAKKTRLARGT